jgi:hypothetical protein
VNIVLKTTPDVVEEIHSSECYYARRDIRCIKVEERCTPREIVFRVLIKQIPAESNTAPRPCTQYYPETPYCDRHGQTTPMV